MTRVKISAAILFLLVGISAFSSIWVNHSCDNMLKEINTIYELAEKGDKKSAQNYARKINADWESFREKASVLLKYDRLIEIDRLCSRIVQLTENEGEEMNAELAELRDMLEMLKSGETPLLNSVF
ncbi:MAG: DUF4363 family protein [Ruminococcus sp.]|uniref:DUF4363 family protein n=1 Tax=Ruminococcus sp. TaxID=41978 RepID=UPI0025FA295A|nr:DUF4363 family protein [Ruminococcus sp.]MCR4795978.1 DUF4363 family protein [Ruminococcus sp.]